MKYLGVSPHGVVVKVLDCDIVVSEFNFQFSCYIHFQTNTHGKGMNTLSLPSSELNNTTSILLFG